MAGKPAKTLQEKVKLSQLRTFTAVAMTGSFSAAAFQLDVSQSTVSHSIAALEDALGIMLIHRGRQGASLTPVGEQIFAQAQQALSLIEEMGQTATRARGIKGGLVRVAAFRSLASEVLPEAIAILHQAHPTVQVVITEFDSLQEIETALLEGKADFAAASLIAGHSFERLCFLEDPFIALLPPGEACPPSGQLSWDDLRQHPVISSSSECCRAVPVCLKQTVPPIDVAYLISNDSTAVSMTRQGLGITILPQLAALPIPVNVQTARLPFEMSRPLGLSWLSNTLMTPAAYAFLDVFKARFSRCEQPDGEGTQQYGVERYGVDRSRHQAPTLDESIARQSAQSAPIVIPPSTDQPAA